MCYTKSNYVIFLLVSDIADQYSSWALSSALSHKYPLSHGSGNCSNYSECGVTVGIFLVHIFLPRCACASEVYGSVFVCVCVLCSCSQWGTPTCCLILQIIYTYNPFPHRPLGNPLHFLCRFFLWTVYVWVSFSFSWNRFWVVWLSLVYATLCWWDPTGRNHPTVVRWSTVANNKSCWLIKNLTYGQWLVHAFVNGVQRVLFWFPIWFAWGWLWIVSVFLYRSISHNSESQ